jgi:glycosyltransferase involved in cell wall biosynthesis
VKISVAIATFKGGRFLEEQLLSISRQTYLPSEIVISDDQSDDDTEQIIRAFEKTTQIPVIFHRNPIRLGVLENFLSAFGLCRFDFIAYCDQDDVWMPSKLQDVRDVIAKNEGVKLVIHQSRVVDANLTSLNVSMPNFVRNRVIRFPSYPYSYFGFGHQMVFDRELVPAIRLFTVLKQGRFSTCFDWTIPLLAGMRGDVFLLAKDLVLFRRHGSSTTTAGLQNEQLTSAAKVERKSKELNSLIPEIDNILHNLPSINAQFSDIPHAGAATFGASLKRLKRLTGYRQAIYQKNSKTAKTIAMMKCLLVQGYVGVLPLNFGLRSIFHDLYAILRIEKIDKDLR